MEKSMAKDFRKRGVTPAKPKVLDGREIVVRLAGLGLTNKEVASVLGLSTGELERALRADDELRELFLKSRADSDRLVEKSLYKQAVGYTGERLELDGDGNVKKRILYNVPANIVATIFWLKNRLPDDWSDVRKIDHNHTLRDRMEAGRKILNEENELRSAKIRAIGSDSDDFTEAEWEVSGEETKLKRITNPSGGSS